MASTSAPTERVVSRLLAAGSTVSPPGGASSCLFVLTRMSGSSPLLLSCTVYAKDGSHATFYVSPLSCSPHADVRIAYLACTRDGGHETLKLLCPPRALEALTVLTETEVLAALTLHSLLSPSSRTLIVSSHAPALVTREMLWELSDDDTRGPQETALSRACSRNALSLCVEVHDGPPALRLHVTGRLSVALQKDWTASAMIVHPGKEALIPLVNGVLHASLAGGGDRPEEAVVANQAFSLQIVAPNAPPTRPGLPPNVQLCEYTGMEVLVTLPGDKRKRDEP